MNYCKELLSNKIFKKEKKDCLKTEWNQIFQNFLNNKYTKDLFKHGLKFIKFISLVLLIVIIFFIIYIKFEGWNNFYLTYGCIFISLSIFMIYQKKFNSLKKNWLILIISYLIIELTLSILHPRFSIIGQFILGNQIKYPNNSIFQKCLNKYNSHKLLSIDTSNIKIYESGIPYLNKKILNETFAVRAMVLGNTLYLKNKSLINNSKLMYHEIFHIYQYQNHDFNIISILKWLYGQLFDNKYYNYTFKKNILFNDYNLEQQAELVADYFIKEKYVNKPDYYMNLVKNKFKID